MDKMCQDNKKTCHGMCKDLCHSLFILEAHVGVACAKEKYSNMTALRQERPTVAPVTAEATQEVTPEVTHVGHNVTHVTPDVIDTTTDVTHLTFDVIH